MIISIHPEESTYITNENTYRNTSFGADELLELQKTVLDNGNVLLSRILVKFDQESIQNANPPQNIKYTLLLRNLERKEVLRDFQIDCFQISSSWISGVGKKYFDYNRKGANWTKRDDNQNWYSAGGDYISSSICQTLYKKVDSDLEIDVTNIFSGSFPTNGLLIKISDESSSFDYGLSSFFSEQTKTVYFPELRLCWDDSTYVTGSLETLSFYNNETSISTQNLKKQYSRKEVVKIRLLCRDRFIKKSFQSWPFRTYPHNDYSSYKVLPSESFYRIYDKFTNETIIDYSDYTKISADESGSFFKINMSPFYENREYKISIKSKESDLVNIYDLEQGFSISNIK